MTRVRRLAKLVCLGVLATSASSKALPESEHPTPDQVTRHSAPAPVFLEPLDTTIPVERAPFIAEPVDQARREAGAAGFVEFSGGPTGTLLAAAALLSAVTIILAVLVPW